MYHPDQPFAERLRTHETWLASQTTLVAADLKLKHKKLKEDAFGFLRGSYFDWRGRGDVWLPEGVEQIAVRSVGDLHIDNFGTWRDREGRLIYGVSDFDEAESLPFTQDLVRLVTSAALAGLKLEAESVAADVLKGYRTGLGSPRPVFPDEIEIWLRPFVVVKDKKREAFWEEVDEAPGAEPPEAVRRLLQAALPEGVTALRYIHRSAGVGSLGLPRYAVVADDHGGQTLREAKPCLPARLRAGDRVAEISRDWHATVFAPARAPDPWLRLQDGWIIRRLSPGNRKIDLDRALDKGVADKVFEVMGFELGGIHGADPRAAGIPKALAAAPKRWLAETAEQAAEWIREEWQAFKG